MPSSSSDPATIQSIAVTVEDVVAAAEANRTTDRTTVLRVTPPFSGRMRARLHVRQDSPADDDSVHILPGTLLSEDAPAYPRPANTEDQLRADPSAEYTVERHREFHQEAVEQWRETVPAHVRESVTIETASNSHELTVHLLG